VDFDALADLDALAEELRSSIEELVAAAGEPLETGAQMAELHPVRAPQ